ncbi:MAG: MafI family immunity protein [Acidimicrobiales bacterium]
MDYLAHNETVLALEHLIYVIGAADLPVKGQTFDTISEAVDHLGIDRALLSGIDPQRGPIRTLTDIAAIARQTPTLAVKLLGSD